MSGTGGEFSPSREEAEQLAHSIVSQLRAANESAKGIAVAGKKLTGVVFVIGHRDIEEPRVMGKLESSLPQNIAEAFLGGWLPLGFVRWQSKEVGTGTQYEITTQMQPFPHSEHLGPWASEMLTRAVVLVRSGFRPN